MTFELPQRSEPRAQLWHEEPRLFPGREVPALVEFVVVDELGVRALRPAPRSGTEIIREDAHRDGDGDALRGKEGELVLPVQTGGRDPRILEPVKRDVVEDVVPGETLGTAVEDPCHELVAAPIVRAEPGGEADG